MKNVADQASNVSIQLNIVEVVAGNDDDDGDGDNDDGDPDQASNVPIQLDIVEIVACSIHLPWVQLCRVLHVKDCLELQVLTHLNY